MTSDHFRVYSSAGQSDTRAALEHMERVHSFFEQVIGKTPADAPLVDVVVFGSEKEYLPVRLNEFAVAYYHGQADHDYIVIGKLGEQANGIVAHEYTHLAFQHAHYNLPAWLSEGVAELFSTLRPVGKNTEFGAPIKGRLYALSQTKWVPLQTILGVDHSSPYYNETERAGVFYNESWALVHMLATTRPFGEFVKVLEAVRKGTPAPEALEQVFGPLAALDAAVQQHVRKTDFNYISAPLRLAEVSKIPAMPADPYAVRVLLADLMAGRPAKRDEARTRYEALKTENPSRPEPWAGLAYLDLPTNRQLGTENLLKAFELGARNPRLLNDVGRLAAQSHPEKALEAMQLYVKSDPENVDARINLASLLTMQRKYPEALAVTKELTSVKTVEQRDRLLMVRANAALQAGDRAEARKIASELQKATASAMYKQQTEAMLNYLNQLDAPPRRIMVDANSMDANPRPALVEREEAQNIAPPTAPPPTQPKPVVASVKGQLVEMVCQTPGKMIVDTEGIRVTFLITNPNRLIVTGRGEGPAQLTCGAQKPPLAVEIDYTPLPQRTKEAGEIRAVHFQ